MPIAEAVRRIKMDGWCVVPGVIPENEVDTVRQRIVETARSDPRGKEGARHALRGLINYNQSLAPYLADDRVLGIVETFFGPYARVSFTTGLVTTPGQERGNWHSDWPFGQTQSRHIPAPYADAVMHLTTIWMLTTFTKEAGGTLLAPGSHRVPSNPSGDIGIDAFAPYPTEMQATGEAGSVLIFDSRLWHATAANVSNHTRVAVVVRYAPWWLNLNPLVPGIFEYERVAEETGTRPDDVQLITAETYAALPEKVRPLFTHIVER